MLAHLISAPILLWSLCQGNSLICLNCYACGGESRVHVCPLSGPNTRVTIKDLYGQQLIVDVADSSTETVQFNGISVTPVGQNTWGTVNGCSDLSVHCN